MEVMASCDRKLTSVSGFAALVRCSEPPRFEPRFNIDVFLTASVLAMATVTVVIYRAGEETSGNNCTVHLAVPAVKGGCRNMKTNSEFRREQARDFV